MAWLVECVADILTKYMQGNDGKTGYERLFGKEIREEGLEFGEQIWWRKPRKQETNVILDPRWSAGTWLGRKWGTILHLVAVGDKVLEVRAVIRRPKVDRWERTILEGIRATPWQNPAPPLSENIPGHVIPPRAPTETPAEEPIRDVRAYAPHRVRIENSDLDTYGYTSNCKRCLRIREGRRAQGIQHHEECRTRIEAAMREVGDRRIRDADQRMNEEIARLSEQLVPRAEEERGAAGSSVPCAEGVREAPAVSVPAAQAPVTEDSSEQEEVHVNEDDMVDSLFRRMPRRVGEEATRIYELVLAHGCDPCDAKTKVCELYSPPRVTKELGKLPILSLVAGSCFDLRMDADGRAWDFRREADRREARRRIQKEQPYIVIGSPPCVDWCQWNEHMNFRKMDPKEVTRRKAEARVLLDFAIEIYTIQLKAGRHFLHEHPAGATSWKYPGMLELMGNPHIGVVVGDQCCYGLKARVSKSPEEYLPAMKPTRFLSTSEEVLKRLSRRCKRAHKHQQLHGGRASAAAIYPPGLCRAILKGIEAQKLREGGGGVPCSVSRALEKGCAMYSLDYEDPEVASSLQVEIEEASVDHRVWRDVQLLGRHHRRAASQTSHRGCAMG